MFKNKKNNLDDAELTKIIERLKNDHGILEDTIELFKLRGISESTAISMFSFVDESILEIISKLQKFQNSSNC